MSSQTTRDHIRPFMWEIGDGAHTAIIGHGTQWHVLIAIDTFNTLTEAVFRLNEIETNFENGSPDQSPRLIDLLVDIDHALPFIRAMAPAKIVSDLESAVAKLWRRP